MSRYVFIDSKLQHHPWATPFPTPHLNFKRLFVQIPTPRAKIKISNHNFLLQALKPTPYFRPFLLSYSLTKVNFYL